MTRIPCPAPGIYRGVPAEEYHAWEAASNSALTLLARTPAHCRSALDKPKPPTPAMIRGDALHLAMLEPDRFADRYVVPDACAELVKSGIRAGEPCGNPGRVWRNGVWRCGQHDRGETEDARTVLSAADYADCLNMQAALRRKESVADLLDAAEDFELSIVFDWPGTDIRCKARPDIVALSAGVLGDLKKTTDAGEEAFGRAIQTYGYHRQAPFYRTAFAAHGFEITNSVFVAVEEDAPYGVQAYRLKERAIAEGRSQLARLLVRWRECTETGIWPDYPDRIVDIDIPAWGYAPAER